MENKIIKNGENFRNFKKERKRILVTGGAGLIGSNLVKELLKQEDEVIVMDNLYSSNKSNLKECFGRWNFEFIRQDVNLPFNIEVDEIYHLACPASPIYYQKDPVYTIKTSFYGALNVLENAKRTGARVLLASTSEVYGDPLIHPQKESYWGNVNPTGPRSCYDEGKRASETLFSDYHREYDVDIRIARIFNTYGPGMSQNDGRVISNFVMQALKGYPLTIYGDGSQTRSFCYVDDMILGLMKLMELDSYLGPINLGNPDETSIKDIAIIIAELTGNKSGLQSMPLPTNDPLRRKPDISLAKMNLKWEPEIRLEEGMKQTIEYFKGQYL